MLIKIYGSAIHGVAAQTITIEVNVDTGGVGYHLVGLPDNAIKESSYRISAALKNVGFKIPGKKITINMAPADLRKEGSAYDLSIAIGILTASDQILAENVKDYIIMESFRWTEVYNPLKVFYPLRSRPEKKALKESSFPSKMPGKQPLLMNLKCTELKISERLLIFLTKESLLRK